jgi:hypothetical protein
MATSGTISFNMTRTQIIERAYKFIKALGTGQSLSAAMEQDASEFLNMMIKAWQADDLYMWTQGTGYLFLASGTANYAIGSSGTHATASYVKTTLTATAAAAATTLTVSSIAGISASDNIAVILDTGAIFWTTVSGAPSGSTVTLASGLPTAAASGRYVFAYTTKLARPLEIEQAWLRDVSDTDTMITLKSQEHYFELPNKLSVGTPTFLTYNPNRTGTGTISIWPTPSDLTDVVCFRYRRVIEDMTSGADDADFPQEWLLPLSYNLASLLQRQYGGNMGLDERTDLRSEALAWKEKLLSWNRGNMPTEIVISCH